VPLGHTGENVCVLLSKVTLLKTTGDDREKSQKGDGKWMAVGESIKEWSVNWFTVA
jgi:hypothetical protein